MQQLLTQACTSVMNITNNCLEADKSNKTVESRTLVTKAPDAITRKLNTMLPNERKTRLKSALSESPQSLWDQDFSQSVHLSGNHLAEDFRKAKSLHFLGAKIKKLPKRTVSVN